MRGFSGRFDAIPVPPDTVSTFVVAGVTAEAGDYPSGANVVRVSAATTASAGLGCVFNDSSTKAHWPAADLAASTDSSGRQGVVPACESRVYRIDGNSTGFSVAAGSSGIVTVEFWKIGG